MGNCVGITVTIPLDKIVSSCTCPARESFRSLQKDWERLITTKNDVQTKIDIQVHQQMTMLESVSQWLQEVETTKTKFEKLETYYIQQSATKCFCATKYCCGYTFGKSVANVREEVGSLLVRKPDQVAQQSLITVPVERPVEPTIGMHSMLKEAWSYMEDEQVGIIALHGMGGVGKTTLMKKLNNKLCNSTQMCFDVVFWIVISSNPILSKVQNDIGEILKLTNGEWNGKSQEEKSVKIYDILKQKKYVLFLDDVWQRFDLTTVGVPYPNVSNKSKVVLTTRSSQICGNMNVDRIIQVKCLCEKEAWDLFSKTVGEKAINAHLEIPEIAKLVAKECTGLPLALIVIGQTMSTKKTPRAWRISLNQLRSYATDFTGMGDQILPRLKFSYDNLSNHSIRSCLLYCSLYPEDCIIPKEDIIDKWICEGFLDRFVDLHYARDMGYDYIDTLVNASLLEESSFPDHFTMHDIIREMAIWIACDCGQRVSPVFVGVGLTEAPNVAEFQDSERMSLMGSQISKLTGKPNCPNLLTLFLNNNGKLNHIDNEFFQSMPKLRVLDFSSNHGSQLEIPEEICNLVTLQYLNLAGMKISKLLVNLHKLINLKWLNLRILWPWTQIPEGLLSSFKMLQVIDLDGGISYVLPETFMEEIESLKHLNDLRIRLLNDVNLSRFSSSHKLVGITTRLNIQVPTSTNLDLLFSQNMVNLKELTIHGCVELEYVISKEIIGTSEIINCRYMKSLETLYVSNCRNLKDITVFIYAPSIEKIYISGCEGMKELCGEWKWDQTVGSPTPFPKLKYLMLRGLPQLERIYPNALPLFSSLQHMEIYGCPKLKKLAFNSSSCNAGRGVTIKGDEEWWNGLEWEDEATGNAFRHCFSMVLQSDCSSALVEQAERTQHNKKEAFCDINHHLIDGGTKSFWLDKLSGKKCYMIAARGLLISWGDDLYWKWISLPESRFAQVAMLDHVWWLSILGRISIGMLSPGTKYVAYLVFMLSTNPPARGFSNLSVTASVGTSTRMVGMVPNEGDDDRYPKQRKDGWMEIELGQYFYAGGQNDEELVTSIMETSDNILKSGLIVEGIEIRPAGL